MLAWIREKFGTVVISGIIGFIAFVFIFYGLFNPKATRGLHEGAVAGMVNGEAISISEFNREVNHRMEFFRNIGGEKLSDEQLKAFKIREMVFQDLVNRKLLVQEGYKRGRGASDEEVKEKIQQMDVFKKDKKFNVETYREILEANHYTLGSFEKLVRDDATLQGWQDYVQSRVHVSDEEAKQEFELKYHQVNLKYVLLTPESARGFVTIPEAKLTAFLQDPAKQELIRLKYGELKDTLYKNKTLSDVQDSIARDLLSEYEVDAIQAFHQKVAAEILPHLSGWKGPLQEQKIQALLKPYHLSLKTTGLFSRRSARIPEIGEARDLLAEAFKEPSSIDLKEKGQAGKFAWSGRLILAALIDRKKPNADLFKEERSGIIQDIASKKSKALSQKLLQTLTAKAAIEPNSAVVGLD